MMRTCLSSALIPLPQFVLLLSLSLSAEADSYDTINLVIITPPFFSYLNVALELGQAGN